ncbi:MAG: hypothetical protein M3R25_08895, partial [Bacteroidota bacterium]|nr:hypothetical protein [Bacteroidota bacterium]
MTKSNVRGNSTFEKLMAVLGWLTLAFQLYLIIENRIASLPETIIRYFSFYTILTNILVAIGFTIRAWSKDSKFNSFFVSPSTWT